MLWLEMSVEDTHGGGSWGFTKCLWSPSKRIVKGREQKWGYWEPVKRVKSGDSILHLRGKNKEAKFVGFSTADGDGYETTERPPTPGDWGFATSFYRVNLVDYTPFPSPIMLYDVFNQQGDILRQYYLHNKAKPKKDRALLFYVIQAQRLQCQNGAYLSEVNDELASIILGRDYSEDTVPQSPTVMNVTTGERIGLLKSRVGQKAFADNVRENYGHRCCFPECNVADSKFLIGAHVARWSDVAELRGHLENGLCLCLMHDKAFEAGFFTLTKDLKVKINTVNQTANKSPWCSEHISPYDGHAIRAGRVPLSVEVLKHHWERIGFTPD